MVFIIEVKSVYCAVRTGSLNQAATVSYLKGKLLSVSDGDVVMNT